MKMRSQVLSISITEEGVWIARDGHGQIVARISGGSIVSVLAWAAAYDERQWVKFVLQDTPPFLFPKGPPKRQGLEIDSDADVGYTFGGGRG